MLYFANFEYSILLVETVDVLLLIKTKLGITAKRSYKLIFIWIAVFQWPTVLSSCRLSYLALCILKYKIFRLRTIGHNLSVIWWLSKELYLFFEYLTSILSWIHVRWYLHK